MGLFLLKKFYFTDDNNVLIIIIILFIVQCWTQASKPEPLKQDTQKGKDNRKGNKLIFNTLK